MVEAVRHEWRRYLAGGAAAVLAYSSVLTGIRLAPVGYIAALREASVVLAAVAGWLFLHEHRARSRIASSAIVAVGLVLLITAR
jgi:drug/metabolite transporter (DMT)-like permease